MGPQANADSFKHECAMLWFSAVEKFLLNEVLIYTLDIVPCKYYIRDFICFRPVFPVEQFCSV